ncbi:MAG: alpha/beta hydrolase-fold protein [Pseudomonadota bacterium]
MAKAVVSVAFVVFACISACGRMAETPLDTVVGEVRLVEDFPSEHITPRNVFIWTPPGYETSEEPHQVLYMADGQNLFDPRYSHQGVEWNLDETLSALIAAGDAPPTIVVGVWSTADRFRDYAPPHVAGRFDLSEDARYQGALSGAAYLDFLTTELKPFIDRAYRTRPERSATFHMGASMGGLVSLYAATHGSDVFGGAGCLSTHWPLTLDETQMADFDGWGAPLAAAFAADLRAALPSPGDTRLWFDHGSEGLDAAYAPYQTVIDETLRALGFEEGRSWRTRIYPGAGHSEGDWAARLEDPLRFLLSPAP